MLSRLQPDPTRIDAVITWVDGDDPAHKAKRLHYLGRAKEELHENGTNPHRWACGDELQFCLRSIENHAPWIGSIFIVTDAQTPELSELSKALRAKIKIVDHREIFAGFEHVLPTFNSLAIESMMWRIDGLAEHFLYFNDDVFLTAPLKPRDVFSGECPLLRGKWVDNCALGTKPEDFEDPALFHHFMQRNGATLAGFDAHQIFASAHVVHPLRVSVFADLFVRFEAAFLANISHRFRDISQFQPQSLHTGACLKAGQYGFATTADYLHIRTGVVEDMPPEDVRDLLRKALSPQIKFLCINDLSQIEAAIPDARDWIEAAIAPVRQAA
jgi:hypothetical protein